MAARFTTIAGGVKQQGPIRGAAALLGNRPAVQALRNGPSPIIP
jgi:hypothetical protein